MDAMEDEQSCRRWSITKAAQKEKIESFWPEKFLTWKVTDGTIISPGIPSNWRIFESNWLDIESQMDELTIWLSISSQFDSNILQLLGILSRISVPSVTQFFKSKRLNFFSVRRLTRQVRGMNLPDPFSRQSKLILFWEEDKLETDLFSLPKSSIILLEGRPMLN